MSEIGITRTYVMTLAGCLVLRDSLYQYVGNRVCYSQKLNTNPDINDLTSCQLELSKIDYKDFIVCPFCNNSMWKSEEVVYPGVAIESFDRGRLTAFCVSENPALYNSQWIVGYLVSQRLLSETPAPLTEGLEMWRSQVQPALVEARLWRDLSFGFYTVLKTVVS